MFDPVRRDARFALRGLLRSPVFTVIAIVSIGVGVGATTAIVTLANTLLLKPPPGIGKPEKLVTVGRTQEGRGFDNFSYPNYLDYQAGTRTLLALAAVRMEPQPLSLAGPAGGEAIQGGLVTGNFFDVLQARPSAGRFFHADEDRPGGAGAVTVLNHRFWRTRFAADPAVVGRKIVLNGSPFTVVGVAAERFQGPFVMAPDLWIPLRASSLLGRPEDIFNSRQAVWLIGIGRLARDASRDAVQAELGAVAARLAQEYPDANAGKGIRVMPVSLFPGDVGSMVGAFMAMLLGVAGLVLLIASTNVAGMLLARAAARQREIAVRLALGASRGQLVRQLATESVILFLAAGAAGVALSYWLVRGLMALVPTLPVQLAFDPRVDWRVLAFALVISLVTGLAAGLVPALQSTRPALVPALKLEAGHAGRRQRLRGALLVSQLAFSMLLLVVAGLFARALAHARAIDPGFDPHNVEIASLDLDLANYDAPRGLGLTATLLDRVRAMPEVRFAAFSAMLPLGGGGLGLGGVQVEGRTAPDRRRGWDEDWDIVTPGYFRTLGIPLVRGRDFSEADRQGAPDVAILNQRFAGQLWPGEEAIGRTFRNGDRTVTVVGIARDAKYRTLGEDPRNFVYVPLAQRYLPRMSLLVRTAKEASVGSAVRRTLAELDKGLPILDQRTLEEQTATSLFPQRVALWVAGSLGAVALLLALLGIYGVTAMSVAQRTREIGVRMALGAARGHVLGLVVRQGVLLAGMGVGIGAAAALAATRLLGSLLYGVPAADAIAFAGAAALLSGAAVAASWIPARRAARIDPVIALRAE